MKVAPNRIQAVDSLALNNELAPINKLKLPSVLQLMDLAMVDAEKTLFPKDGKTNPAVQNDTTYGVRGELGELTIDRSSTEVPDLA